jgi:hypothetical protein
MKLLAATVLTVLCTTPSLATPLVVDDALLSEVQTALDAQLGAQLDGQLPAWLGPQANVGSTPLVFPVLRAGLPAANPYSGTFGIGLQVGSPTAVTVKLAGPHESGFAFGVGAGFGYGRGFGASLWLHADYLFHLATLLDGDGFDLGAYAGPGLFVTIFGRNYGFGYAGPSYLNNWDYVGFGIRVPVGLSLAFEALPLEVFLELDPALSLFPGLGFGIGASLGFRVYF